MIRCLLTTIAIALLISCGQQTKITTRSLVTSYLDSSEGTPILLKNANYSQACPSLLLNDYHLNITSSLFTDWNYVDQEYFLPVRNRKGVVKNGLLSHIYLGGERNYVIDFFKGEKKYFDSKNANVFTACPGYNYSKEDTYEAAATSTLFAFNELEKLSSSLELKLPPVKLRIAPILNYTLEYFAQNKKVKENKVLINNAFYNMDAKEIVFLPQGYNKNGKIPFGEIPLWKIPFVGVHEYGHHLFTFLMNNYTNLAKTKNIHEISLCFDNKYDLIQNNLPEEATRKVTLDHVMHSLNEGVADLLAGIMTDADFNLKGVPCFEFSREVSSEVLANSRAKRFDRKVLDVFLAKKTIVTQSCYRENDFQDPHIIGAILAHGMMDYYNTVGLKKIEKVEMVIQWLRAVNEAFPKLQKQDFESVFTNIILLGLKTVKAKYNVKDSDFCRTIVEKFPMTQDTYHCD